MRIHRAVGVVPLRREAVRVDIHPLDRRKLCAQGSRQLALRKDIGRDGTVVMLQRGIVLFAHLDHFLVRHARPLGDGVDRGIDIQAFRDADGYRVRIIVDGDGRLVRGEDLASLARKGGAHDAAARGKPGKQHVLAVLEVVAAFLLQEEQRDLVFHGKVLAVVVYDGVGKAGLAALHRDLVPRKGDGRDA